MFPMRTKYFKDKSYFKARKRDNLCKKINLSLYKYIYYNKFKYYFIRFNLIIYQVNNIFNFFSSNFSKSVRTFCEKTISDIFVFFFWSLSLSFITKNIYYKEYIIYIIKLILIKIIYI